MVRASLQQGVERACAARGWRAPWEDWEGGLHARHPPQPDPRHTCSLDDFRARRFRHARRSRGATGQPGREVFSSNFAASADSAKAAGTGAATAESPDPRQSSYGYHPTGPQVQVSEDDERKPVITHSDLIQPPRGFPRLSVRGREGYFSTARPRN